ncbi:MAG: hypothetical protein ACOYL5_19305 [Phototrophicaceae bacterium]|jgi:hypothetical protein
MPNEPLIQQLDELRAYYTHQRKAALSLQTSLKTAQDSQIRLQKALTDYRDQNTAVTLNEALITFRNLDLKTTLLDPLLPELRRELKILGTLTNGLKDAIAALRSDPVDVTRLDKACTTLQSVQQPNITDLLAQLYPELDLAQRALGDLFGYKLRDALLTQGINIGGRPPRFELGRFEIDANFARRTITIRYGKDVVIPRAPITVEATVKAYQQALKQVAERSQDGKVWISQLYDAYHTVRRKLVTDSVRVNIVDCYREMVLLRQGRAFASEPSKQTFTDYTRAQFIYDFYQMSGELRLTHNGHTVKAHVASKSQADNPTKSMWIVEGDSPYDGRYIADIEFVKE